MSKAKVAAKVLGKGAGKSSASKAAKRKRPSKATQKGVRFSKGKDIKDGMPSREEARIDAELRTARVAKGSRKPSVTVGKKSDPAKFEPSEMLSKSAKARIKKMVEIEAKIRKGTATAEEKKYLKDARAQDAADLRRRNVRISQSSRGRKKEVDNFAVALRKAKETGELGEEFEKLTKNQQDMIVRSAKITKDMPDPQTADRKMLARKLGETAMSKGGKVTKRATGAHDYRMNKGGLLLSSVDNRKKK